MNTPHSEPGAETADIETSSPEYARRFTGPVGAWMLDVQWRIVAGWLAAWPGAAVLDVGGGHGQLARPMADLGCRVTVLGSAEACRARLEPALGEGRLDFRVGSVVALPFPDRAFDVAVSIRLLPHCRAWPVLVRELCRVARRAVIVDYPAWRSVNVLSGCLFGLKRRIERNTRPFALFTHGAITREFERNGLGVRARRCEFFWPMVLHRLLRRPGWSAGLETLARRLGATAWAGSPALVRAEPKGAS